MWRGELDLIVAALMEIMVSTRWHVSVDVLIACHVAIFFFYH
jgi:hypothetical protein